MVLDKRNWRDIAHHVFREISRITCRPGDCLVLNNTKVIPARLFGVKEGTQAKIEILLLKRKENDVWETLVKPGKEGKSRHKDHLLVSGLLVGEVIRYRGRWQPSDSNLLMKESLKKFWISLGQMPLPPYITHQLKDKNRYQTVYAKYDGSAAAPTAGLAFYTGITYSRLRDMGIDISRSNTACRTWHFPSGKSG
ncbi:MAG: S-adenosylmethionine:tRNA ribosyltransferase-isomerase [Roseburia sp.]